MTNEHVLQMLEGGDSILGTFLLRKYTLVDADD